MTATKVETAEAFAKAFPALQPLICAEWAAVDSKALAATEGDYEKVVALVTSATEHSRTLVKRHLGELVQIANEDAAKAAKGDAGGSSKADGVLGVAERSLQEALRRLQAKANEVAEYVRKDALTDAKRKAEEHPLFVALLVAVGLGFILGFLLRGHGRDRYPRS
jgi:hypothetical protein